MSQKITDLDGVKPFKTGWRIQVKLLHLWKQFTAFSGETLEAVFSDQKGIKIHGSCKKAFMNKFEKLLVVGEWMIIANFNLTNASGLYRPTAHVYKMSFLNTTTITRSAKRCSNIYTNLVDFDAILGGKLKTCFLIDVLGQVLDVGEIQNIQCGGKPKKKLEFTLRDINDQRVACCLWGKFAEIVQAVCEKAENGTVICLIRFAKIGSYHDKVQISNAYDASLVVIDPEIEEAKKLKQAFNDDSNSITIFENPEEKQELKVKREKWSEYPFKTISELQCATQVDKCKVVCTIDAIDIDWGWFYFGCKACNKRVVKNEPPPGIKSGTMSQMQTWYCEVCDDDVTNVKHRFKLHLLVKDETGKGKFLLLDTPAMQITKSSAYILTNGSFDELEDPSSFPFEITSLVGQTFTFGISLEKDNVQYGSDLYKAMKVWMSGELDKSDFLSETESQSNRETTLISGNEETPLLTDSEEVSEDLKTPSKRSNDGNEDVPDLTSTSKKVLTKKIKIEKLTKEEMNNQKE